MKLIVLPAFIFAISALFSQSNSHLDCRITLDTIVVFEQDSCSLKDVKLKDLHFKKNNTERYYKHHLTYRALYDSLKYMDHFYVSRPKEGLVLGLQYINSIFNSQISSVYINIADTSSLHSMKLKKFYSGGIIFFGININAETNKSDLDNSEHLNQYKIIDNLSNFSKYVSKYTFKKVDYIFKFNDNGQLLSFEMYVKGRN